MRMKGINFEEVVFTGTGIIHPNFAFSFDELKNNRKFLNQTTQEDVVDHIRYILKTGIYPRRIFTENKNNINAVLVLLPKKLTISTKPLEIYLN